jgi:hypothetical protein
MLESAPHSSLQNWPEWFSDIRIWWLCWPGKLKLPFMLLKPWLKSVLLFRTKVWIMGCTWLSHLSTCSLAAIQPWRVTIGSTSNHNGTSPCRVPLLETDLLNWRHLWVFPTVNSSWCRKQHEGQLFWQCSSCLMSKLTPWFVYLSTTFNDQSLTMDASEMDESPIFRFSHKNCYSTQSLMHWHKHSKANTNKFCSSIS